MFYNSHNKIFLVKYGHDNKKCNYILSFIKQTSMLILYRILEINHILMNHVLLIYFSDSH